MVYKIGLISTHGTGKTSLKGLVEGELKRRKTETKSIDEMSTKAKERGLPINEATTLEAQLWILHNQFAYELLYSAPRPNGPNYEVLICDRGPDNYCYLERKFGRNEYALNMTLGHIKLWPYSRLYFLPIVDEEIAGNGVRSEDKIFQKEMDGMIRQFLIKHQINYEELPLPQPEDVFRDTWAKMVVNQTLKDLGKDEKYFIR